MSPPSRPTRLLRPLDVQMARLFERLSPKSGPELPLAAAFASWATGQGHTCLPLSALAGLAAEAGLDPAPCTDSADPAILRQSLLASPVVGRPGEARPLILDADNRLYLLRFFRYETDIAATLGRLSQDLLPVEAALAAPLLAQLFPASSDAAGAIDWQRSAAALALVKRVVVISGGPGTGKTYTAARILALLLALAPKKPRIVLAAPTGKAALRLKEALMAARIALPPVLAEAIPSEAQTLHRLLGYRAEEAAFLHHRGNPLHLDVLLLDEASMIDVPLMAALMTALPPTCRVILLGDRDQLASVEAGNLLGDLSGSGELRWSASLVDTLDQLTGASHGRGIAERTDITGAAGPWEPDPLADSFITLRESRRFKETSGIGRLARAVNTGDTEQLAPLFADTFPDLLIEDHSGADQIERLNAWIELVFQPVFQADSPGQALQELSRRRILCALAEGPGGVTGINALAEALFRRRGLIPPGALHYPGLPVLIRHNDYRLDLFNGDTGVLWPDGEDRLMAWFPGENGTPRAVALARLPAWQTSYALTVHKSQGSEFTEVLLVLPPEDSRILTRELLYTGITRARERLLVLGRRDLLFLAMQRRIHRASGLRDRLRQEARAVQPLPSF